MKLVKGKQYALKGNLTLRGVTKPVTLNAVFNGTGVHPYSKKTVAGFKITGTIKRSDFGVGAGTPSAVLGEEVDLNANIEDPKKTRLSKYLGSLFFVTLSLSPNSKNYTEYTNLKLVFLNPNV
jgi:hypothetical protein